MEREQLYHLLQNEALRFEPILGSEQEIVIPRSERRRLFWVHEDQSAAELKIRLEEGASLELVELFSRECFRSIELLQGQGSESHLLGVMLGSGNANTTIRLQGREASSRLRQLFIGGEKEHCELHVTTLHEHPDGRSDSLVKGVVGGEAKGVFRGMVYVAPQAQRTDARQTSRNIELSKGAKIITEPQLEIYADDVKCSHGATVGQLDPEAIFYMRQRGLSEKEAHRLQIEGFASDILSATPYEELGAWFREAIIKKLQSI